MRRFAAALSALLVGPAAAGWSVAYAPATNLERLDAALLSSARTSIDMAAYVLTDVPVIDALAAVGARGNAGGGHHPPCGGEIGGPRVR